MKEDVPLRIAMLAPVSRSVPPNGYGPTEQVIHNLTEELTARGHKLTLFAAAGSQTSAELVETVSLPFELWSDEEKKMVPHLDSETGLFIGPPDFRALEQQHIAACMEAVRFGTFDVVHSHLHAHAVIFSGLISRPLVSTLHGAAWVSTLHPIFDRYCNQPYVAVSEAEKQFRPDLNYLAAVYNGIQLNQYPLGLEKKDYVLFAEPFFPENGAAEAIEIAKRAGRPLHLTGVIEPRHMDYFETEVKPHLDGRNVSYLGSLPHGELAAQYSEAAAVLFPIRWCEPTGWGAMEAQASGTPVIATRCGALPEVVRDRETGFLVDGVEEAAEAIRRVDEIDPRACRAHVEQHFSSRTMAEGYEKVYQQVAAAQQPPA